MPLIPLEHLEPHPDNANRMSKATLAKLMTHLRESNGRCPPLIVRPHPSKPDRFQLLDGHHRALALGQLGHTTANCEIWPVDDQQATVLLLTLNRLHGEDDPARRGALLERLSASVDLKQMVRLLPDDTQRIEKLIALHHPPPRPAAPPPREHMLQAVTFFLTEAQRARLFEQLSVISHDRSAALVRALALDEPNPVSQKNREPLEAQTAPSRLAGSGSL